MKEKNRRSLRILMLFVFLVILGYLIWPMGMLIYCACTGWKNCGAPF